MFDKYVITFSMVMGRISVEYFGGKHLNASCCDAPQSKKIVVPACSFGLTADSHAMWRLLTISSWIQYVRENFAITGGAALCGCGQDGMREISIRFSRRRQARPDIVGSTAARGTSRCAMPVRSEEAEQEVFI